jgi:hypothetical protein
MDGLIVFTLIAVALAALAARSSMFGVDSRDGFTNERLQSGLS